MERNAGLLGLGVLALGLALILPPTAPFAALALPGLIGEALRRRWPRVAALVGGLLACAYIALVGLLVPLCGLGDEVSKACDRVGGAAPALAWWFGAAAVVLTAAACLWPRLRATRYALWATPAGLVATLVVVAL